MALNFPSSPTLNQVFTSGSQSWSWNGTVWVSPSSSNVVTLSTTQTISGVKTFGASVLENRVALGSVSSTATLNLALGNIYTATLTANTTFSVSNTPTSGSTICVLLDLTNGGAFTITWWTNMKWASGTAPTLTASGRDMLSFITHDGGTTWTGLVLGKDIK